MLARLALAALASLSACVPKIESRQVDVPYPLVDFDGPESLPDAPEGTQRGIAMRGAWRIVHIELLDGDAALEHLFQPGWFLQADDYSVASVQGTPPLWPVTADWRLNRVDGRGIALGFGFATPRGNLNFLHYAFVAAADSPNHARAIEALHFEDARFGGISWATWSIELERVQRPPVHQVVPSQPRWPE